MDGEPSWLVVDGMVRVVMSRLWHVGNHAGLMMVVRTEFQVFAVGFKVLQIIVLC